jgi:WD40 repeat protein
VVGSAGGSIRLFNMQSGQYRRSYPCQKTKYDLGSEVRYSNKQVHTQHTKAVTGLAIDSLNRTVVSCGLDGKVKVGPSKQYHPCPLLLTVYYPVTVLEFSVWFVNQGT